MVNFDAFLQQRYQKLSLPLYPALTYSDVCIQPAFSELQSRSQVDTSVQIGRCRLSVPVLSSNFPFVDGKTSVLMSLHGGMAVLSRDIPIEEEVARVRYVKEYYTKPRMADLDRNRFFIQDVIETDLESALIQMKKERIAILFFSQNGVSPTHYILWADCKMAAETGRIHAPVQTFLRPLPEDARCDVDVFDHRRLVDCTSRSDSHVILITKNDKELGFVTSDFLFRNEKYSNHALNSSNELVIAAAVGARDQGEVKERTQALLSAGTDALVIDVAHGDSHVVQSTVKTVQKELQGKYSDVVLIAGNIATSKAAEWMLKMGIHVKVGIGPGRTCKTRTVAGVGVPQLKAVIDVAATRDYLWDTGQISEKLLVIADGGFQGQNGNIAKAFVAGADVIMRGAIGRMLEPPTERIIEKGIVKAQYFGNGSLGHQLNSADFEARDPLEPFKAIIDFKDEGERHVSPVKYPVCVWLALIRNSLQISGGYIGAKNLYEFAKRGTFVYQSQSAIREGLAGSKR